MIYITCSRISKKITKHIYLSETHVTLHETKGLNETYLVESHV